MKDKIGVLLPAIMVENLEYYIRLFENQTYKNFTLMLLSSKNIKNPNFKFDYIYIKECGNTLFPNIKKMRHAIPRNEILLAAEKEDFEYILTWDAYQIPYPQLLEEHLKYLQRGYHVCGQYLRLDNLTNEYKNDNKFQIRVPDFRDTGMIKRCTGNWRYDNNSSGRLKDYIAINGWDLRFCGGNGGDDVDLGMRLERNGGKFLYNPNAKMAKTQHLKLKLKYSKISKYHNTNKFRTSPWDYSTNGDDSLMSDDYLQCYFDKQGIKRYYCKQCGEEGLIDSVHLLQYNKNTTATRINAGLQELDNFLNKGKDFKL